MKWRIYHSIFPRLLRDIFSDVMSRANLVFPAQYSNSKLCASSQDPPVVICHVRMTRPIANTAHLYLFSEVFPTLISSPPHLSLYTDSTVSFYSALSFARSNPSALFFLDVSNLIFAIPPSGFSMSRYHFSSIEQVPLFLKKYTPTPSS